MRILVTVKPRMYRETLAFALREHRPDAEVMFAFPESLNGMGARINLDGWVWKMDDMSVEDPLAVVDEVAEFVSGEPVE